MRTFSQATVATQSKARSGAEIIKLDGNEAIFIMRTSLQAAETLG